MQTIEFWFPENPIQVKTFIETHESLGMRSWWKSQGYRLDIKWGKSAIIGAEGSDLIGLARQNYHDLRRQVEWARNHLASLQREQRRGTQNRAVASLNLSKADCLVPRWAKG